MNSDALAFLAAKGLSLAEIIEFARISERKTDRTNAERQARHREKRKAVKGEKVTRYNNGVTPPIEEDHTPQSDISPNGENQTAPRKKRGVLVSKPEDVSEQVWSDFINHRRKVRADVSQTAIAGFRREADRVGWTLEQAISEIVLRGWRGFKAEWIKTDDRGETNQRPVARNRAEGDGFSRSLDNLDAALAARRADGAARAA
jgi:hypothetical protein